MFFGYLMAGKGYRDTKLIHTDSGYRLASFCPIPNWSDTKTAVTVSTFISDSRHVAAYAAVHACAGRKPAPYSQRTSTAGRVAHCQQPE